MLHSRSGPEEFGTDPQDRGVNIVEFDDVPGFHAGGEEDPSSDFLQMLQQNEGPIQEFVNAARTYQAKNSVPVSTNPNHSNADRVTSSSFIQFLQIPPDRLKGRTSSVSVALNAVNSAGDASSTHAPSNDDTAQSHVEPGESTAAPNIPSTTDTTVAVSSIPFKRHVPEDGASPTTKRVRIDAEAGPAATFPSSSVTMADGGTLAVANETNAPLSLGTQFTTRETRAIATYTHGVNTITYTRLTPQEAVEAEAMRYEHWLWVTYRGDEPPYNVPAIGSVSAPVS